MNREHFELLCRDASKALGLEDTDVLGSGLDAWCDGVLMEVAFAQDQQLFVLMADLGEIATDDRAGVYENLLAMQLSAWDDPGMCFVFNPMRGAMALSVRSPLDARMDGTHMAQLLKATAQRVTRWRETELAGKVFARRKADAIATPVQGRS
jgi:hypothetical protein